MDFVSRRKWAFAVSMLFIIVSIVSLLLPRGLTPGLEFTGGSSMTIAFETNIDQEELRIQLTELGHPDAIIQRLGDTNFFLRTRTLQESVSGGLSERESIINSLIALIWFLWENNGCLFVQQTKLYCTLIMKQIFGIAIFVIVFPFSVLAETSVEGLLDKVDWLYRSDSSHATMEMKIVTENWERTTVMEVWSRGMNDTLIKILSPRKDKGIKTLKLGNQMWNYFLK